MLGCLEGFLGNSLLWGEGCPSKLHRCLCCVTSLVCLPHSTVY